MAEKVGADAEGLVNIMVGMCTSSVLIAFIYLFIPEKQEARILTD